MPTHILRTNRGINNQGGAFWCANMRKNMTGGMLADYSLRNKAVLVAGTSTAALGTADNWAEMTISSLVYYWMKQGTTLNLWTGSKLIKAHVNTKVAGGNGLLVDFGNQLIYVGNRYIGRTVTPGTLDGAISANATSIPLTAVTGLPTAGELVILNGSNTETISYTGITTVTLTGVTRGLYGTTGFAHTGGQTVVGFKDDWADLGADGDGGVAMKFQDYILVSNGVKIAGWKVVAGTDLDANLGDFNLPGGYVINDFSQIVTGAGERVLISANKGNEGALFIWDAVSSDWDKMIKIKENIDKLCDNFIATDSGIYKTDGYSLELAATLPDYDGDVANTKLATADMKRKGNFLIITSNLSQINRNRGGVWILDLSNFDWFYIYPSSGGVESLTFAAILISVNSSEIFISHNFNSGAIDNLTSGSYDNGYIGQNYQVIYDPQSTRVLRLRDIKLTLDLKLKDYILDKDFDFDVIVRYYTFSKIFIQYGAINGASANAGQFVLTESGYGLPVVGDRVELVERTLTAQADVAGQIRNITGVTTAAGKHTITLDSNLSATPGANLANTKVIFQPLIKIAKRSFSGRTINNKDLVFIAQGQPEFKKLLIEVEFVPNQGYPIPGLSYIEITSTPTER